MLYAWLFGAAKLEHLWMGTPRSKITLSASEFFGYPIDCVQNHRQFVEAEMLKDIYNEAESRMKGAIQALEEDLAGIRTGRASPGLIEKLSIDYYGTPTPLIQLASIGVPEPRSLLIRPFDPSTLKTIERSIQASDLGLTPNNDGKTIRLNLPPLTQERREELSKIVHNRVEEARIAVRNVRRDEMKDLQEFEKEKLLSEDEKKRGEDQLQKITDRYIEEINAIGERKEKEILEV
jgi:ribosome recycling factor